MEVETEGLKRALAVSLDFSSTTPPSHPKTKYLSKTLQDTKKELESVNLELEGIRKEKFSYQSRVTVIRSSLKNLLNQYKVGSLYWFISWYISPWLIAKDYYVVNVFIRVNTWMVKCQSHYKQAIGFFLCSIAQVVINIPQSRSLFHFPLPWVCHIGNSLGAMYSLWLILVAGS